jgi:site-specific DNA-methyltransferase (adenine-specific)
LEYKDLIQESYYHEKGGILFKGDCLEWMAKFPDKSVDMILCDLPYGTTACKWDSVISFEFLWEQYKRIVKDNSVVLLFGSEPFSTIQRMSNLNWYKYDWYWEKTKPNGWQHSKNRPMTKIETISVFSQNPMGHISLLGDKRMRYNPQGIVPSGKKVVQDFWHGESMGARQNQVGKEYESYTNFPHNILRYANITSGRNIHPTQKPIDLCEYLIKTYTNENEIILDNTAGVCTTAIACKNINRRWICIEKEEEYCDKSVNRIKNWKTQ